MQLRDDIAANPPPEEEGDGNEPSRAMESDVVVVKRPPLTSVVMKRVCFDTTSLPTRRASAKC